MLNDQMQREFIPLVTRLHTAAGPVAQCVAAGKSIDPAAAQDFVRANRDLEEYFKRAGKAIAKTPRPPHAEGAAHGH